MIPDELDDLFRRRLEGHETPPDAALWARLAAGVPSENEAQPAATFSPESTAEVAVDKVFRAGLTAHASPVRRALWERLEDEHLRPRQRRAAAYWPLALAAVLALLVVAGGAGLGLLPLGVALLMVLSLPAAGLATAAAWVRRRL